MRTMSAPFLKVSILFFSLNLLGSNRLTFWNLLFLQAEIPDISTFGRYITTSMGVANVKHQTARPSCRES